MHLVQSCGAAAWVLGLGMGEGTARQIAGGLLAVAVVAAVGWGLVVARRGRRFLVEHPEPAAV